MPCTCEGLLFGGQLIDRVVDKVGKVAVADGASSHETGTQLIGQFVVL